MAAYRHFCCMFFETTSVHMLLSSDTSVRLSGLMKTRHSFWLESESPTFCTEELTRQHLPPEVLRDCTKPGVYLAVQTRPDDTYILNEPWSIFYAEIQCTLAPCLQVALPILKRRIDAEWEARNIRRTR